MGKRTEMRRSIERGLIPLHEIQRREAAPPLVEDRGRQLRSYPLRDVQLREAEDGTLEFTGYAAVFNTPSEGLVLREIILPGAFTESLANNPDVRLLYNHDPDSVMARTTAGTLELTEDTKGLKVRANLDPEDWDVQRVAPKMRAKHVTQMSFAFWIRDADLVNVDGVLERHIAEADIDDGDVSPVTYPAYKATSAELAHARALGSFADASPRSRLSAGKAAPDASVRRAVQALALDLAQPAELRELNDWTLKDLVPLLYAALDQLLGTEPDDVYYYWFWIRDVSDEWFVYVDERPTSPAPGMFQVPYTVDAGGEVTTGEPVKVIAKTTYLPAPDEPDDTTGNDPDDPQTGGDEGGEAASGDTPSTMTIVEARRLADESKNRRGARRP